MWLTAEYLKAFGLLKVHLLLNDSIEECSLHIHLVNVPSHLRWERKNHPYGIIPCDRCKGLLIINPLYLWKALGNKSCLVLLHTPVSCLLNFVDPSRTHHWFPFWSRKNLPCTISDNRIILFHHGVYPCRILHIFLERGWLNHNTLAHKNHVSRVPIRWLSLPVLGCRWSNNFLCILSQSLNFCQALSPSDGWRCMSGLFHSMKLVLWLIHILKIILRN